MNRLFVWNEQEACYGGPSIDGFKYRVNRVDGGETETLMGLDAFQAAQLVEALQDFVRTRKPHVANNLFWGVRSGELCVNDVYVCNLRAVSIPLHVLEVLSTLLTANRTSSLFDGFPETYNDVALEHWIQTRLDAFNEASEF